MNAELLKDGIASLGGTVTEQQIGQFAAYAAQLWEWNQKINLTAIVDPDGIAVKHLWIVFYRCFTFRSRRRHGLPMSEPAPVFRGFRLKSCARILRLRCLIPCRRELVF